MFVPNRSFKAMLGLASNTGQGEDTWCRATGAAQRCGRCCPHQRRATCGSHSQCEEPPTLGSRAQGAECLNALRYDGLLRRHERTFSPFHRRVFTTDALEVGASGDGDNRDHSFSAFRAVRYAIHEILPIFTSNSEPEFLFHSSVSAEGRAGPCQTKVWALQTNTTFESTSVGSSRSLCWDTIASMNPKGVHDVEVCDWRESQQCSRQP